MNANDPTRKPEKYYRLPQVEELTSLKKSSIYCGVRNGTFPVPVKLTAGRAVAWRESDIVAWQAQREQAGSK